MDKQKIPDSPHNPSNCTRSRHRVHFATPISTLAHTTMMSETDKLHTHSAPAPTHPPTKRFAQRYWKHAKRKCATTKTTAQYTKQQLKQRALNGSIPSDAYDTACTSNAEIIGNPFIQTPQQSTKVLSVADDCQTPGSNISKLHHPVRKPA